MVTSGFYNIARWFGDSFIFQMNFYTIKCLDTVTGGANFITYSSEALHKHSASKIKYWIFKNIYIQKYIYLKIYQNKNHDETFQNLFYRLND